MQETQLYEDKLQELEAKCIEESQLKEGKFLSPFYLVNLVISEYTLD
jgi:hypothetical protein